MAPVVEKWAEEVRAGDVRALSRAITAIENHDVNAEPLLRVLFPHTGEAYLIGVTGAPGTGKSTLVDRLAAHYRKQDEAVGVIAVDPTSPYSGGAILGDRIRMQGHAADAGMFIRSMATRVIVVVVPGMGDDIQNMKAGLMEIADIFVVNKSDREGADRVEQQLNAMLSLVMPQHGWHPPVVRTVASENPAVDTLAETVANFRQHFASRPERQKKHVEHWKKRLLELLESRLLERAVGGAAGGGRPTEVACEVAERRKDPFTAVTEILGRNGLGVRGQA